MKFIKKLILSSISLFSTLAFASTEKISMPFTMSSPSCFYQRDTLNVVMVITTGFLDPYTTKKVNFLSFAKDLPELKNTFCATYFDPLLEEANANKGYVQADLNISSITRTNFICDKYWHGSFTSHCEKGHYEDALFELVELKFSTGLVVNNLTP